MLGGLGMVTTALTPAASAVVNSPAVFLLKRLHAVFRTLVVLTPRYMDLLTSAESEGACAPNSCLDQLTSALIDTFLLAGGLSAPAALRAGLFTYHADHSRLGDLFPSHRTLNAAPTLPFVFEVLRFFPPVVDLPYWVKFPPTQGAASNQPDSTKGFANKIGTIWENNAGERQFLSVGHAGRDPAAWGEDASKFRVRSIRDYHRLFTGFADQAVHPRDPSLNRACPGKGLALQMLVAFFDEWKAVKDSYTFCGDAHYVGNHAQYIKGHFDLVIGESCPNRAQAGDTRSNPLRRTEDDQLMKVRRCEVGYHDVDVRYHDLSDSLAYSPVSDYSCLHPP